MNNAYKTIRLERSGPVAILTLSRPDRMNAIDKQMLRELQYALDDVERDDALRVLIVQGAGGNFSSGFDLKEQIDAAERVRRMARNLRQGFFDCYAILAPQKADYRGSAGLLFS
jgi:enoyl-CoA hydratase/carnithine racemase